jgi:hypothetical protein
MKASASKHKAMSYERMKRQEKELTAKVEELLRQSEARDALDDQKYGKGKRGDELPEDLRHTESRLAAPRRQGGAGGGGQGARRGREGAAGR